MPATILLVEDAADLRDLYRGILETSGYTVLAAQDGPEALRIAEAHPEPIDLLVTDLILPGVDGQEVARRLLATHPTMKVLYISGYADEKTVAAHAPVGPLLRKPIALDALRATVKELLRQPPPG